MALPDWRDEVCAALDFWIAAEGGSHRADRLACIGRARPGSERGWYDIDLRGTSVSTDQVESFRLSVEGGPDAGPSYQVLEAIQDGPLVRVRVADFVNLADAYLWQNKQSAAHLLMKLREGIAAMADAGLAHDLAAGRLASRPQIVRPVAGFTPMQQEAYESCLAAGVRLVWGGPPGTGKTRVLSEAISELLATGLRVLLVSATNIAVDNALLGVIGHRRHQPGQLLRVGLPHHPDVLNHPDVCLPHLVREQLAEVERQRQAVENRLLVMRQADDELAKLQEATAGFDPVDYGRAVQLLAAEAAIPGLAEAAAKANATAHSRRQDAHLRHEEVAAAESRVQGMAATRSAYAEIDQIQHELAEVIAATDDLSARALTARHAADQINAELNQQGSGSAFARMRGRSQAKRLANALAEARQQADDLERRAREASELLGRVRLTAEGRVQRLSATTVCSRAEIDATDAALGVAQDTYAQADAGVRQADEDLGRRQQALLAAKPSRRRPRRRVPWSRMQNESSYRHWRRGWRTFTRRSPRPNPNDRGSRTNTRRCKSGLTASGVTPKVRSSDVLR